MDIKKRNGELEPFDKEKFVFSLKKAGFNETQIDNALVEIEGILFDGISTDEIYDRALDILKNTEEIEPMVKYSLKRSVLELGPSGFPFEQLVSRIYQEMGYTTATGVMLKGHCIEHEIDVVAYKGDELILIEAKFHNEQSMKSDTKVALYVKARFDDLKDIFFDIDNKKMKLTRGVLITNTGFTNNSKKYVSCVNTFDMISWSYPKGNGLLKMIENYNIHPVTSIPRLSQKEKMDLIDRGYIYCKDLLNNPEILNTIRSTSSKKEEILDIARSICKYKN